MNIVYIRTLPFCLEPERTHDMSGFPRMNLQYVLERKTPQHLKNELEGKDLRLLGRTDGFAVPVELDTGLQLDMFHSHSSFLESDLLILR